ncbi:hypothetical protein [Photobacterium indicum]|uniref:hypothetical protein n=1 Tax=Photobacterium indicum TaxID=81447 RepID=UPI003D14BB33
MKQFDLTKPMKLRPYPAPNLNSSRYPDIEINIMNNKKVIGFITGNNIDIT